MCTWRHDDCYCRCGEWVHGVMMIYSRGWEWLHVVMMTVIVGVGSGYMAL